MKLKIRENQAKKGEEKHETIRSATGYFLSKYLTSEQIKELDISISLNSGRVTGRTKGNCSATLDLTKANEGRVSSEGCRVFKIRINREQNIFNLISTLAHELIHIKQYTTNQLVYGYDTDVRREFKTWEGKLMHSPIPYRKRPWEIEAFNNQDQLARDFFSTVGEEFTQTEVKWKVNTYPVLASKEENSSHLAMRRAWGLVKSGEAKDIKEALDKVYGR